LKLKTSNDNPTMQYYVMLYDNIAITKQNLNIKRCGLIYCCLV